MADAKRAIVLLSGGLDSATALAEASAAGFEVHALSFRYGQRHQIELRMAARQAELQRAKSHRIVEIDLAQFGGSALTTDLPVPQGRAIDEMSSGIPITYVPARNTIFLSFALAHAEVLGAFDIFIGVNAVDYSGYPDCRPEFIRAFQEVANLGTRAGVERPGTFAIRTPLIHLTKAEIIRRGLELGVDYSQTSTCYSPDPATGLLCGKCDACQLRLRGFAEVGINDPVGYQAR